MIGILYLLLCFGVGWAICTLAFPQLGSLTKTDYLKRKISVSPFMILIPAWFCAGTLCLTWATYLLAYLNREAKEPLFAANLISLPAAALVIALVAFLQIRKKSEKRTSFLCKEKKALQLEAMFLTATLVLAFVLMWTTFFVSSNQLYIGVSVFSDFSPHIGMIRSFSYGNNFPTTYPHYAGQDIRYHFMFQFLAGNLEYLGLRIDYAFNLPSMISFMTAFMLLYLLAVKITGKLGAGVLACLFFAFRSSKTLFTYLAELPKGTNIWKALAENTDFLSSTPNEEWGLWNLNVYCNQRHLAFGLTAMFLLLILYLPHLYEMFEELKKYKLTQSDHEIKVSSHKNKEYSHKNKESSHRQGKIIAAGIRVIFFTRDGWVGKDYRTAAAAGILLGGLSFFHGAAVIGILTILFVMAVLSKRRLEYLVTAVIALCLSMLQTHFFIHGSVVSTKFLFGFIAENKTLFGAMSYLDSLLGLLPWVLLVAFCLERGVGKYLILAFSAPLIFAFTISLTVDVTVNHKYIMMSCILLGIFAAGVVSKLWERKDFWSGVVAILLVGMLTATGIYDFTTVLKKNTPNSAIVLDLKNPLTAWVNENSTSQDIFLTSNYTINQVVLGGAMLYEGWPYYPWSAGYDTNYRTAQVKRMYEAATPSELKKLAEKENIRFIIVDSENRESTDYALNEENIRETYECVYSIGEGDQKTSVYDTRKPLQ